MQITDIIQILEESLREHEQLLAELERRFQKLPAGSLYIKRQNGKEYYLRRITFKGKRLQIPIPLKINDGHRLLNELFEKRAIYHGLPIIRRNTSALKAALRSLSIYDPESYTMGYRTAASMSQKSFLKESEVEHDCQQLILPDSVFLPRQLNTGKWVADTLAGRYRTNPSHPENLKFKTRQGRRVRSKSEVFWDDALLGVAAVFRYENALALKSGKVIYPDFTVLHPKEPRLVFIEHFGRMDDPRYAMRNMRKLQEYAENGWIPGRDVFFTMETKEQPLTSTQINAILREIGF